MRKITKQAAEAFHIGIPMRSSNTEVTISQDGVKSLFLYGHEIARHNGKSLWITNAGYPTNVTKERLNALPDVSIYQKNYQWYLNDRVWDGSWIEVTNR